MVRSFVLLLTMIVTALPAGRAFWTWLGENPNNVSGVAFVEFFQALDRGVAAPMAITGFGAIVLTAASAFLCRSDRVVLYLLIAACVFSVASAFVTIVMHLPINAKIAAWDPSALPTDYRDYLQTWWRWHHVRLITTVVAMITVFVAVVLRHPQA
jgi:uncharacterized membrane protein